MEIAISHISAAPMRTKRQTGQAGALLEPLNDLGDKWRTAPGDDENHVYAIAL